MGNRRRNSCPQHDRHTQAGSIPASFAAKRRTGLRGMTGTIIDLRAGGFGFIASDAFGRPWSLQFRRAAVTNDGFAQLQIGERVRFDQVPRPGKVSRSLAVRVVPLPKSPQAA